MWAVTPANVSGRRLCSSPLAQPERNSPSNSGSKINLSRERSREMWHEKSPLSTQSPQPPHHSKARCRRTTMKRRGTVATSSVLHATGTSKRLRFEGGSRKRSLAGHNAGRVAQVLRGETTRRGKGCPAGDGPRPSSKSSRHPVQICSSRRAAARRCQQSPIHLGR